MHLIPRNRTKRVRFKSYCRFLLKILKTSVLRLKMIFIMSHNIGQHKCLVFYIIIEHVTFMKKSQIVGFSDKIAHLA